MLKTALVFAVLCFAIALFAPGLLSYGLKPPEEAARVAVAAPIVSAPRAAVTEPIVAGSGEAVLRANAQGQYVAEVFIDGQATTMMVDTGASFLSLSWETARRLGIASDPSGPRYRMTTASGEFIASGATVHAVSFQGLYMNDVQAIISPPDVAMPDLLGASFLKRLESVEQRDGVLILRR